MVIRELGSSDEPLLRCRRKTVPIEKVMPDELFSRWQSVLDLMSRGFWSLVRQHECTEYYRQKRDELGVLRAKLRILLFWNVFRSIRDGGYVAGADRGGIVMVRGASHAFRVDGAHRACVLRFLGYRQVVIAEVPGEDVERLSGATPAESEAVTWWALRSRA